MVNKSSSRAWAAVVVFLGLAMLAIHLGVWQLGRAQEKEALMVLRDGRASMQELGSSSPGAQRWREDRLPQDLDQQRVALRGVWMLEQSIALDNRAWEGRAGVHVLTPMELADGSRVWINRGWMAKLPGVMEIEIPAATATEIEGVALASVMRRMELASDDQSLRQGRVWQNFDWRASRERVGDRVWPVIVWQTSPANDGLLRRLPEVSSDVPKHLGYAAQWFLLCLLCLFFAWRLRPKKIVAPLGG